MGLLTRRASSVPATVDRLRDEFDRVLQHFWDGNGDFEELSAVGDWHPSVDVSENDNSFEVKVDLPGIKPEDVDISVTDDRLTIQGERKEEKETKEKTRYRVERRYGSFYRSIALPAGTESDSVSAASDNGVITITVPKGTQAKAKRIAVKPK
jgi:HSP20 family protein